MAQAVRYVKPLISETSDEARIRVLGLYKAWYRHIPFMCMQYDLRASPEKCREVLKSNFLKNAHHNDIRVIDMMVFKGQQDLREVVENFKEACHIEQKWFETGTVEKEKPKDFISKFLSNMD
uniref:NADH dehydrogenase [ubiquinone] 1 alpha subcomplex subunit 6 n=1 Tax=Acartia pacifica TaxID=335913 RepID=A0A0U2V157_ACAPC|nr:NADH dehydrogenase [Acartia pacifica]